MNGIGSASGWRFTKRPSGGPRGRGGGAPRGSIERSILPVGAQVIHPWHCHHFRRFLLVRVLLKGTKSPGKGAYGGSAAAMPLSFQSSFGVPSKATVPSALVPMQLAAMALCAMSAPADSSADPGSSASDPMVLYHSDSLTLRGHIQVGANLVAEDNLFWDLAARAAGNTAFDADARWLELYFEPGLSFESRHSPSSAFFGAVSAVASSTSGTDAFDASDTGRVTLEEAYLGFRTEPAPGWGLESSLGPRLFRLGTGHPCHQPQHLPDRRVQHLLSRGTASRPPREVDAPNWTGAFLNVVINY